MSMTVNEKLACIAKLVFEQNLGVKKGEQVVIRTYPHTVDAADELYLAGKRAGTEPFINMLPDEGYFRALRELDTKDLKAKNEMARMVVSTEDVEIFLAGPKDPKSFQSVTYEKVFASQDEKLNQEIIRIRRARKVRAAFLNIGQATPERAAAYGIEYEPWRDGMLDALMVDPSEFSRIAKPVLTALKKGKKGTLRSHEGGILTFNLAGKAPVLDDGVLRTEDIKRGDSFVHLPAGVVFSAVKEGTANGRITYDIPQPSRGRYSKGVWVDVKKGVMSAYGAIENEEEIRGAIEAQGKQKFELGYLTIGVNPSAKPFFIDHQMAQGVVGFHFGSNATFGGKLKDLPYHFGGFSQFATLEIDGKPIIVNGKITG